MHAASDEDTSDNNGAISHKSRSDPEKRGTKKRPRNADHGKAAKITKHEFVFKEAQATDKKLQCIFVDGELITLWPQYMHKEVAGDFIRFGTREPWLNLFMAASRRST